MNFLWTGMLVGGTWLLLPTMGVVATGIAFAVASAVQFSVHFFLATWFLGYRFNRLNKGLIFWLATIVSGVLAVSYVSELAAVGLSLALSFIMAVYSVHRLHDQVGSDGRLGRLLQRASLVTEPVHKFIFRKIR